MSSESVKMLVVVSVGVPAALAAYAYLGYPLLLKLLAAFRAPPPEPCPPALWPRISITVPAYNEEASIRDKLENLLALDYPVDRRQILVVSDASTDETDRIVLGFADRGVELLRMPERVGKTEAENVASGHLTGDIVVNTDASVRIHRDAVKPLVMHLSDPGVGVASGRDISVGTSEGEANVGESGYVGYEMWIRDLETQVSGIVGASGCLYAIRKHLHDVIIPKCLSRDFSSVLRARQRGYRAVSVSKAVCFVPRAHSLHTEYKRKVRTVTRGIETLFHKQHRQLLNPFRFGVFAWMLLSHKLCRWFVPVVSAAGLALLGILSFAAGGAQWLLAGLVGLGGLFGLGWRWCDRGMPRVLSMPVYVLASNVAILESWLRALRGERDPIWEPTRRGEALEQSSASSTPP